MQEVPDDVFAFDAEPVEKSTTPEITNIIDDQPNFLRIQSNQYHQWNRTGRKWNQLSQQSQ